MYSIELVKQHNRTKDRGMQFEHKKETTVILINAHHTFILEPELGLEAASGSALFCVV